MRVLVVDQDSASNLAITRSLRDLYTVDCVSNKGDSLDLLRANTYEVIVATERLEDGSGLELLGTISKKWPSVLRIFAAERQRLQLLRGRLGPFELFQTLAYPIDPEKLIATLEMAAAAQHGEAEHIELTNEAPAEEPSQEQDAPPELEQSDEFEEPRFARAGRASGPAKASSVSQRSSGRSAPPAQARPAASAQRARSGSAAAPAADSPRGARARRSAEPNRANELAAKFPGSGTIGPRRVPGAGLTGPGGSSGGAARSVRPRSAAAKAPPVRFPPLERTPPLERIPPLEPPSARKPGGDFSEAAAMARAARSNYESSTDEVDTKRLATLIGGGVAVAAVVVFLAFKMFGSKSEAPKPAAPVVAHAPEYPPEVTDLIAQIESALKADDFKTARADVDKLRQLSPSHPRLDFFDGLLSAKSGTAANGRGAGKKNGKSGGASSAASSSHAASVPPPDVTTASPPPAAPSSASNASTADASPTLPPETPAGMTLANAAAAPTPAPATAPVATAPAAAAPAVAAAAPEATPAAPPAAAETAHTPAQASPAPRRAGGEPPPVVQEAKLVRRVNPDYPSAAKKDGISGFVDLQVTVSKQGNVDDVSVIQSTPPDMFDKSAVAAVRKWKYDPRFVDGLPSTAHLKVHLEFGPNK